MTTNTNSAQERTASIDLDKLTRYDANIPMGRMQACSDGDYFKVEDVRALARRASATPSSKDAGGEPMYQISIDCTNVLWKDVDKEDYDEHPSDWKREKRIVYAAPAHAAAAPSDLTTVPCPSCDGKSACDDCTGQGRIIVSAKDMAELSAGAAAKTEQEECRMCNGTGIVGFPPDQYEECPDCIATRSSSAAGAGSEQQGTTMLVRLAARPGCPEWMEQGHGDVWTVFRDPNKHGCYQRTNGSWLCVPVAFADEVVTEADSQQAEPAALARAPLPDQDGQAVDDARDAALTQAARDVLAERRRQVGAEGWTPEHDDGYTDGALARAAAAYTLNTVTEDGPHYWPWPRVWWKPVDARRNLVKAGALILAEIERIDRAAMSASQPNDKGEKNHG